MFFAVSLKTVGNLKCSMTGRERASRWRGRLPRGFGAFIESFSLRQHNFRFSHRSDFGRGVKSLAIVDDKAQLIITWRRVRRNVDKILRLGTGMLGSQRLVNRLSIVHKELVVRPDILLRRAVKAQRRLEVCVKARGRFRLCFQPEETVLFERKLEKADAGIKTNDPIGGGQYGQRRRGV